MSISPSTSFDFISASLDSRISFLRATSASNPASYINNAGFVSFAENNEARFDYDPLTLVCKGLLIEEARTNQLRYSDDFTNVLYTLNQATVSADATTSPDGTTNADKFVEGSGTVAPFIFQNSSVTSGVTYTQTVFAKAAERSVLQFAGSTGFLSSRCNFDLSTGLVGSNDTGGTASMTNMGNGWYRCSLSVPATTTSASGRIAIAIVASSTSARFATYTGDGTSGIFIYGAQLEAGAFATSYIPTTTTALTRNADVATITGTNFSDWWQAGFGGATVQALPSTVSGIRPLIQFDDGTANEIIALRGNTTNPELYIVDGGTPQAQLDAGTIAANTAYSLTGWWATNDCKARKDSGAVVTDTTATIPTVTQARLGSDGTNYLNGHLASINYYDQFSGQIYTRRKNKAVFTVI
jgi:hypothetical protein